MELITKAGIKFYGASMIAMGIQQLFYADFLMVFSPSWELPGQFFITKIFALLLVACGVLIVIGQKAKTASLVLGGVLLMLTVLSHVPYQLFISKYNTQLFSWTQALKALALSGGAFVASTFFHDNPPPLVLRLEAIVPAGRIFFCITMVMFGVAHFLYADAVATLVPAWIPYNMFWTYFAAVALIGSGLSIIFEIKLKLIGMLLGIMIFLWFIMLHIPRAIADPLGNKGNELTSALQALGFSGIAFLIASQKKK